MRVLIVEDDSIKMERIAVEVRSVFEGVVMEQARSYQSAMQNLVGNAYDLLLLDMSLPLFDITADEDGYQIDAFAGRNILDDMMRNKCIVPTIVVTMFETFGEGDDQMNIGELDSDLQSRYGGFYRGIVYYNTSEVNWRESLRTRIEGAL